MYFRLQQTLGNSSYRESPLRRRAIAVARQRAFELRRDDVIGDDAYRVLVQELDVVVGLRMDSTRGLRFSAGDRASRSDDWRRWLAPAVGGRWLMPVDVVHKHQNGSRI